MTFQQAGWCWVIWCSDTPVARRPGTRPPGEPRCGGGMRSSVSTAGGSGTTTIVVAGRVDRKSRDTATRWIHKHTHCIARSYKLKWIDVRKCRCMTHRRNFAADFYAGLFYADVRATTMTNWSDWLWSVEHSRWVFLSAEVKIFGPCFGWGIGEFG